MKKIYPALAWFRLNNLERREYVHFAIVLSVLVVGAVSHVTEHGAYTTLALVALAVVAELVLFVREFFKLADVGKDDLTIVDSFGQLREKLEKSTFTPGYQYEKPLDGQAVLISKDLNAWILGKNPSIELTVIKSPVDRSVLESNGQFLYDAFTYLSTYLHRSGDQSFFNEQKISLRTELMPRMKAAIIGRTGYITGALTNDACTKKIFRTGSGDEILYSDLTAMFPLEQRQGREVMLGLTESNLSNHIGTSTIGLIRQNDESVIALLPIQGKRAARNVGKLVPTGSGSCDWKDVARSKSKDLLSVVAYGASRELCEEHKLVKKKQSAGLLAKVTKTIQLKTMVLGYYRWLDFGGKPEFCSISIFRLPSIQDLSRDKDELAGQKGEVQRSVGSIEDLEKFCVDVLAKKNLSLPLAMNLQILQLALADSMPGDRIRLFLDEIFEK